ncbi:MAG: Ppx/GppA family phosphatase [Wenzhouxiangella sp.]|nr:MAG: Ppx/GppA family phosphatase [Wenzhouxiangella sp.]
MPERQLYAAVDLGSNSFHMIVARVEHGELRVIDRIKDMVRLAGGLDEKGRLDPATREIALASLARFGQRLRDIPETNLRAVGTQTFRRLDNPAGFLVVAETALGCPIDIVSGREEARLVYTGVRQGMPADVSRRLVIDIGGGSTEIVAGDTLDPVLAESIPFGCVATTRMAFPDGRIDARRWRDARRMVLGELQQFSSSFRHYGWDQAVGSSGTIKAVQAMLSAIRPDAPAGINRQGLSELRERMIQAGHIDRIDLDGLSQRRRPVISGGLLILDAVLKALAIDRLDVSDFALREGLLHDLVGRLGDHDPRDKSVDAMARRYDCDIAQADRVSDWAGAGFDQVAEAWGLRDGHRELLLWAARLHEIGLAVSHEGAPQHGAYILQHADMPGFTRQEQALLACLVAMQRDKPDSQPIDDLPPRLRDLARRLLMILRLAITISRARSDADCSDFALSVRKSNRIELALPEDWLASHPLTRHDLAQEREHLQRLGLQLRLTTLPPTPGHDELAT